MGLIITSLPSFPPIKTGGYHIGYPYGIISH